ncbi:nucleotidyl transferase AbiEii/AbiGii toxin family protein [Halosimplex rubrum]|uniref:Nucleotidyl transferase AbiEii/AbiGii toxin family protein n=1 Tax=Halosimplex rubrum TaxID=869889 RepID=A0A7D5P544_9EURY|nr:nucleotidyl transferase AbiEii/AbiGii toxin family protein [Halosimplex rubrum]QLH78484.1 nucleotidyl transferase AbiEii/AbiGii toxin family protein [Halosimplex rubrum]
MISEARVRTLARQDGVTAGLAEKNYVNSWILYALYRSDIDGLVFKGGTALSKLYFPELWRFSEDLDFTATEDISDLPSRLETAINGIEGRSGIRFEITSYHEAGTPVEYLQVKIQYDAVLGQRNTTDLDITFAEPLAFQPVEHTHRFEDVPEFQLSAYSVEEIFVEKLRSIYQRARARDYYDLYRLMEHHEFESDVIADALRTKASSQDVELRLDTGIPDGDREAVEAYWDRALDRLVTEKPEFDRVVEQVDTYLKRLSDR